MAEKEMEKMRLQKLVEARHPSPPSIPNWERVLQGLLADNPNLTREQAVEMLKESGL